MPDEAANLAQDFKRADFSGDGVITPAEMQRYFNETDMQATDEELAEVVREMDADGDGEIGFDEYRRFQVDEPFSKADLDGDGVVTRAEFEHLLEELGLDTTDEQAEKVFQQVNTDGDDQLSLSEWAKEAHDMGDGLGGLPADP